MHNEPYIFAIIGTGPRGHHAIECLIQSLANIGCTNNIKILAFEQTDCLGHGPVYALDQADSNWINITERALDLPSRPACQFGEVKIPHFAGYHEWAELDFDILSDDRTDTFPPRAKLGRYLKARFQSLQEPLIAAGILEIINATAKSLTCANEIWLVTAGSGSAYRADDILLTVGHQSTDRDDQIASWQKLAQEAPEIRLFDEPYPVARILTASEQLEEPHIAIRGYGLATIDVIRAIALKYGKFEITDEMTRSQRYVADSSSRIVVAPFTLNGMTIAPKPLNPKIDSQYAPSSDVLEDLHDRLSDKAAQKAAVDESFLIDLMCPIIVSTYVWLENKQSGPNVSSSELHQVAKNWIDDQSHEHKSLMDISLSPLEILEKFIGMATGDLDITLDYCIGQVWRHCQPTIYKALSHSALADDTMAKIIFVDEGLKRYSYGPPVESHQQLKALHDAGRLDLDILSDPDIVSDPTGWALSCNNKTFKATIMVDAVLDPPSIKAVCSELLVSLLDDGLIQPMHDDLGISTTEDAYIISQDNIADVPIALLGRLAKGTVIGVDAILECFGERAATWSKSAASRAKKHALATDLAQTDVGVTLK